MTSPHLKAVIFDIGGVVVKSPFLAIAEYERECSLPKDYINVCITRRGQEGAWQRFERGEMPLFQFYKEFSQELSDVANANRWYSEHCINRNLACPSLPHSLNVNGRELFRRMMRASSEPDDAVVQAIRRIREHGRHRLIALSNNFSHNISVLKSPGDSEAGLSSELQLLGWSDPDRNAWIEGLFDDFVGSSETGMRKPDPEFYLYACGRNGIQPWEAVFLDDIGLNLRAAKALGMETIQVKIGRSKESLRELGNKIGMELVAEAKL